MWSDGPMMADVIPFEDPVTIFAVVAAIILLAPIMLRRYRVPGMIGLLLAGAALGPNGGGVLARDQSFVLFGTVGLLYIMFMAALEIDLAMFKRYRHHSVVFGVLTFALPQGLGFLLARYVLGFSVLAAVLLASLFASHTLLTYPIASRLGIARHRAVTTGVGGTILTDTLALLVLAVVAGLHNGEMTPAFWGWLTVSVSLYTAAILVGVPILGRWFFRRIAEDGVSEFVFVLAVVFGSASLSHIAGVEPILGAFLAGLALNPLIPRRSTLMNRIGFTGEAIFVPFFLLSVGMLLDVKVMTGGWRFWSVAMGMLGCAVVTKWLAAASLRVFLGYKKEETRVVFGITVAQAAATLAATMVGYDLGLFDETVVNAALFMILGTCMLGPVVMEFAGKRLLQTMAGESDATSGEGTPQRIVVALGKSTETSSLVGLAQLIRDPQQGHPVYPLIVVEETERTSSEVADAERGLSNAVVQLSAADVPAVPLTRIDLNVPAGILRARREIRATEVIVGWARQSHSLAFLFGTVQEKLLVESGYTLLVSRIQVPLNTCRRVVVAVPPNAEQLPSFFVAFRLIKRLCRQLDAGLTVLSPLEHMNMVKRRLAQIKPSITSRYIPLDAWSRLVSVIDEAVGDTDLLILCGMGTGQERGRAPFKNVPARIAGRFPRANLLVIHPADPDVPAETAGEVRDAEPRVRDRLDYDLVAIEESTLPLAMMSALNKIPLGDFADASGMPKRPEGEILRRKLMDDAIEMMPGVVLMHSETPLASRPFVVIGVNSSGMTWSDGSQRVYVLVLLIDPPGRDATRHLNNLSAVAHMFRSTDVVAQVKQATHIEDIKL